MLLAASLLAQHSGQDPTVEVSVLVVITLAGHRFTSVDAGPLLDGSVFLCAPKENSLRARLSLSSMTACSDLNDASCLRFSTKQLIGYRTYPPLEGDRRFSVN